jgi:signal transduction histidine kinase
MVTERGGRREQRPPDGGPASVYLLRALGAAVAAVLLLFVGFEVVEHAWLAKSDPELVESLRRVRGAAAALLAGGVASWLILREGPPVLAAGVLPEDHADGRSVDEAQKRAHHARWFILMRWIAVAVATLTVFVAVEIAELLPRHVGPSLGALIVLLTVLNLGYAVFLRHGGAPPGFLAVQVYGDLIVLILLLHFSGGIENPLTPLLLLHVIIAGIVLGRAHAYLVASAASGLFGLLAWAESSGVVPHYTLTVFPHHHVDGMVLHAAHDPLYASSRVLLQAVVLFLVAYFTTTLMRRIRQDEDELHALAARARSQAQMLERALETTGTALCLCDAELRPYWSNDRWTDWESSAPELSCGTRATGSPARATLADGSVRTREVRTEGKDGGSHAGAVRVFEVTTAPLRDAAGDIGHVVTLARDVTSQREAEARSRRAERLAGVGELAGQVAHEVNNPTAIIGAKARLLLREGREPLPPHARDEIGKIADLADRIARIAQGLLSYCRPAPGARQPLDPAVPVRRALAYVETRAAGAGVRIIDELPPLPAVTANAAELEQVFLNLFLNALDAMPGGGTLRVGAAGTAAASAAAGGGDCVAITVADTGTGIDPAVRDRVFEPFLTTKKGSGSGLGLSICQGLVRSHGGEISLHGGPAGGTCVTVALPAAAAAAAAAQPGTNGAAHA